MKRTTRWAATLAVLAAVGAIPLTAAATDPTPGSDAATTPETSAAKPAKLTPAGRAALRAPRKAMMLPGPSFERLGGPLLAAEEAYANRAYPGTDIPITLTLQAQDADAKVKGKGAGKGKGKDTPEKWKLIGPSEANFPAILTFSGADYTTSGRVTALAIAPGCSEDNGKGKGKGKDKLGKCRMWVGAAGGGVWRTDDPFGKNPDKDPKWKFISDGFATNAIGAITYDAANGVLYAGTGEPNASGDSEAGLGIYKSTDGGDHWVKLAGVGTSVSPAYTGPFADGRSISSIVIDPNNPNVMYVGTARGVRGVSSVTGGATSSPTPPAPPFGLWKSTDGGATFAFMWNGNASARGVNHVEMDPGNNAIIYAAAFQQGVWRSTNGGTTFSQIKTALVPAANTDRAEFAVTLLPNGKTRMYVGDGNTGGAVATQAHFYRTDDATVAVPAFTDLTTTQNRNYCTGQCWYDNFVYTPPGYPDIVYLGGSFSYGEFGAVSNGRGVLLSQNAGASFTDQTWDATSPDTPNGIHPDQHAIVTHPDNPLWFIEGSDGGLIRSSGTLTNASSQCAARGLSGDGLLLCQQLLSAIPSRLDGVNKGLSTLQFQSLSVNPQDHKNLMGGTQDNGTFETKKDKKEWPQIIYGDGGQSGFNAATPTLRFNTFTGQANDVNFQNGDPTKWVIASAPILSSPEGAAFYPPIIADPNPASAGTIFQGSFSVWRTQDWGGNQAYLEANCPEFTASATKPGCGDFVRIGPSGDNGLPQTDPNFAFNSSLTRSTLGTRAGGAMAALARTPSDAVTLWAATSTGRLFISKNADAAAGSVTFTRLDELASNDPNRFISGIAVDPANPNRAYVSYSGYNFNTPSQPGHVFLVTYTPAAGATPASATWTDLSYDLGDLPATGIAFDDVTGDLYASSDFGVNLLQAGTTTWVLAGDDMPNVEVAGLTIVPSARVLYAATHGRSAWSLKLP